MDSSGPGNIFSVVLRRKGNFVLLILLLKERYRLVRPVIEYENGWGTGNATP
jgi:hypothetical protein